LENITTAEGIKRDKNGLNFVKSESRVTTK